MWNWVVLLVEFLSDFSFCFLRQFAELSHEVVHHALSSQIVDAKIFHLFGGGGGESGCFFKKTLNFFCNHFEYVFSFVSCTCGVSHRLSVFLQGAKLVQITESWTYRTANNE